MELIDKEAVVTEIERYKHKVDERLKIKGRTLEEDCKDSALQNLCGNLLHFFNTLEVKEVDLDKEIDNVWNPHFNLGWDDNTLVSINHKSFESIAKHFFELGLKAKTKKELVEEISSHIDNIKDTCGKMIEDFKKYVKGE